MYDDKTRMILSTLDDIKYSLELIKTRCETIKASDDFLKDDIGLERLDGIAMRLVAISDLKS